MFKSLFGSTKSSCFQRDPRLHQAPQQVQNLIIESTKYPYRQLKEKFSRNPFIKKYVASKKATKFPSPFNLSPPSIYEPNTNFYSNDGNAPLLDLSTYLIENQPRFQDNAQKGFYVSTKTPELATGDSTVFIETKEILQDFIQQMDEHGYIIEKGKKYWLPNVLCLDALITSKKFKSFIFIDPLNPQESLKTLSSDQLELLKIGPEVKISRSERNKRKKEITNYYKRLNRGIQMLKYYGISIHNLIPFHEFFIREIQDLNNLFNLSHNGENTGYMATFLIPLTTIIGSVANNPDSIIQNRNEILDFYSRSEKDILRSIDKDNYKTIHGEKQDTNELSIPSNSVENQIFLQKLNFGLIQNPQEETYLRVVLQSDYQLNENSKCKEDGWLYKPEPYARLITIVPLKANKLNVMEKRYIERRKMEKQQLLSR